MLYFFCPSSAGMTWVSDAGALEKAAANLAAILHREADINIFTTGLSCQLEFIFARQVLKMRSGVPGIKLNIVFTFTPSGSNNDEINDICAKASSVAVAQTMESDEITLVNNCTELAKSAKILLSPLENPPRSSLSVALSRIAMANGAKLIYFNDREIHRPVFHKLEE